MSILVPIDFSPVSERVCEAAIEAAKARGTDIRLLHVAQPDPDFVGFEAGPDVVRQQVAAKYRQEHSRLGELARRMETSGVDVLPMLIPGSTVETILDQAEQHDVDLIVMATHGRGVMYHMLVGSVSEGVLKRSNRPILMIPARPDST